MSAQPLRVLALLEAASISGTAKAVLEMAIEAAAHPSYERGIEVYVAHFVRGSQQVDNALTRALSDANIPFSGIHEKGRFDTAVITQIRDLAKDCGAGVIWTNSVKSHFVVQHSTMKDLCKWVAFHHGYTSTDMKMRIYNQLDRFSLKHADRVLTVCKAFAEQMKSRGVDPARIRIQHMPIRPFSLTYEDSFRLRNELRLMPDARVILSVGRLSQEKGHTDLITAFGHMRESTNDDLRQRLYLVLVGDGPERANLQRRAKEVDAEDRIVFAGHRDDAKRFYGIADAFALPSYTEGTPNVLLEAMSAEVPVVCTNVGGIPELAIGGSAVMVPARNAQELANALRKVLHDDSLCRQITQGGLEVVAKHTPQHYFQAMRDIFWGVATA